MRYLIVIWKSICSKMTGVIRKTKSILVIGSGSDLNAAYAMLSKDKRNSVNAVHINNNISGEIIELINSADYVYICSSVNYSLKEQIINLRTETNKAVFIVPQIYEISLVNSQVKYFNDLLVLKMNNVCLSKKREFIKRIFDIVTAVVVIIVTLPLMLCTAALIKLQDGGTVLFCQERLTKGGRSFMLYKFRTMADDAERHTGPVLAVKNDCRITSIGRILRDTRIDELPQLFNVIKGDMSMVGPRPERPYFASKFSEAIPEFRYRLAVKAGITGLAQVLSKYSTTPENKLRFDMFYIKNYSLLLDITILVKTVGVIFKKNYSAGVRKSNEDDNSLNDYRGNVHIL